MVLKLHGRPESISVRRVALICYEMNVPFELVPVDIASKEHKGAKFLAKQPFGQMPLMEDDDGFTLYESRAICRYIATKYASRGPPLLPPQSDIKALAIFEQAASIEASSFNPNAYGAMYQLILKKKFAGDEGDHARAEEHLQALDETLDAYELILGRQQYLADNDLTLADLFHIPFGDRLHGIGYDITRARPNVGRWWETLEKRSAWLNVKTNLL